MPRLVLLALLFASPLPAQVPPGHHLPEGPERPVREREIDIQRLTADLRVDLNREEVSGEVTIAFTPLRKGLETFSLDAADLQIERVVQVASGLELRFSVVGRSLRISLPEAIDPGAEASVRIAYSCQPKAGLYFFPPDENGGAQAWNYGEGGLHYGWLPLYNDTNDRFAVEMLVRVAPPYYALSNGVLREVRDNPDGTRTFRWVQEEPIPNYLLALNVGEFAEVRLGAAKVGWREVPLSVWAPPGKEEAVAYTFRDTPKMVEFFSELFRYPYVWPKYDQMTLREFEGAMETATMVGFTETYQRLAEDPVDSGPSFSQAHPTWTYEDTIAHELAHHWFGDLVTCRSLGSLWLNESFASFAHTLWNGHAHGEDDLTYQRWRYLNTYLEYVHATGSVRPLEYFRYEASAAMYQEETTYIKGALVLHMLRHFVGDEDFFRTLGAYLRRHEFGEVEASDLLAAFEKAAGRNVTWFFQDWIVGGAGHPTLEVAYRWLPERREVDLTVRQVHAELPFEDDFRLPVDIEVVTANGFRTHTVLLDGWSTRVSLPAEGPPRRVVFDKGNWLVAEVRYERSLEELLDQLEHGALAEQLEAARQLAAQHPRRAEAVAALIQVLGSGQAHWGLRQEAAQNLGAIGGPIATEALVVALEDPDRRVRRAAALATSAAGGEAAAAALRTVVESDPAEDVVAVAASGLGRMHAEGAAAFLLGQLERDSHWWDAIRTGALQGLGALADPSLVETFRAYTAARYRRQVRIAAIDGWLRAAPADAALSARLQELANDRNGAVRLHAIETLGRLHRGADIRFLEELAAKEPDLSLAAAARAAIAEIRAFGER